MIHTTGYTQASREALALAMLLSSFAVVPSVEKQTMDGALQSPRPVPTPSPAPSPVLTPSSAPCPELTHSPAATSDLKPVPVQTVTASEYQGLENLLAEVEDFRGEDELLGAAHTVAERQLVEVGQILGRYDAFLN